jgi:AAA+ ATPase superfamily predicted ATPase
MTYAVLGGIPHYLNQFDNSLSLEDNIKRNILTKGCILYSEIEFLLRQELRETAIYNTIIEAVALGNTKLNDIYMKTQIEKAKISVYLNNLKEIEIVEREFSIADSVKEMANTQRGLYKLTDNFFSFWYRFVFTNYSELENGDVAGVYEHAVKPYLTEYASYMFEDICKEYMRELNKRGELPFRYSKIGRWRGKTSKNAETEIDIMAIDSKSKSYIIGECKFRNKLFDISDFNGLQSKYTPTSGDSKIYYYLFSKSGFTEDLLELRESSTNIFPVDLSDIVNFKIKAEKR